MWQGHGELESISGAVKSFHLSRMSILLRVHGGMLKYPPHEALDRVDVSNLRFTHLRPHEYLEYAVQLIEHEVAMGVLENAYVTAMIVLFSSEHEVQVWSAGPNAVFAGNESSLVQINRDLRMPRLRELGFVNTGAAFPGSELRGRVSSIFCVGTPDGYQLTSVDLTSHPLVVALDRGAAPLNAQHNTSIRELAAMDAGWRHGLAGSGLLVCNGPAPRLAGWSQQLIPFDAGSGQE
jgi:hypothetical protein